MRLNNLDLLAAISIVMMNILWVLFPTHLPVIGIFLALPLVFLLPGYTLTEVVFYKSSFDRTYRFTLNIGLSLIIAILSGLTLNLLPGGLQALSWAIILGILTVIFSLLAAYLRRKYTTDEIRLPGFRLAIHEYILLGLSIVIALLAVEYATIIAQQQPHPDFTQLWILPSSQVDHTCAVRIGIQNFEEKPMKYRITTTVNGAQVDTLPFISLTSQAKWERLVVISSSSTNSVYIEVKLYKSDNLETVYREVHMDLNTSGVNQKQKLQCQT